MIKFIKDIYIKKAYEPMGLQLLKSSLLTKKPLRVIENAQELLSKKNKYKLVSKLEEIKGLIASQGQDLFEVLYLYEFLSKDTYEELKSISNLTKLEAEHIETYVKTKEQEAELIKRIQKVIASKYLPIFLGLLAGIVLVKMFKQFVIKNMSDSSFYDFYYSIVKASTLESTMYILIGGAGFVILLKFLVNLYVSKKQEFFKFISLVSLLRQAGLSYLKIFENLTTKKFSSKIQKLILEIYDKLQIESPAKALVPLSNKLEISDALIFIDSLEVGDDITAWKLYKNRLYEKLDYDIEKFKPVIDSIIMIYIIVIMLIALVPMIMGMQETISKL